MIASLEFDVCSCLFLCSDVVETDHKNKCSEARGKLETSVSQKTLRSG